VNWVSWLLNVVAAGGIVAGALFWAYRIELQHNHHVGDYIVHTEDYDSTKIEIYYQRCLRECRQTCMANGVNPLDCNCQHCLDILQ
jgi:hypothetical protein